MPGYGNFGGGGGMRGGGGGRGGGGPKGRFSDPNDPNSEQYRKLFIGGLSYETTDAGLKEHFEKWGEVVDCIVMKDPQTKRSRGFGFITYKESQSIDDAQAERPHELDGRKVETKRAMPREESGNPDAQRSVDRMFVGGMKDGTTEDDIRETFQDYGTIKEISVIKDKATGKMKGFAFVTFADYDNVDKAVLKKNFILNGKNVDVKKAHQKDSEGGGGGSGGRGGRGGGGGGRGGPGGQGGFGQVGGYNQGGFTPGGYGGDSYSGGYSQESYDQGGYGGGYNPGGNWNQFGQDYSASYGGGPMKGYGGNQPRGGAAPYNSGYGRGGGGYNR